MSYEYELLEPADNVKTLAFGRLTWAAYKRLKLHDNVEGFLKAFIGLAEPKLSHEQIDGLHASEYDELESLFSHMITRDDDYEGGRVELTHPIMIDVGQSDKSKATAIAFKPQRLGDLYEVNSKTSPIDKVEAFIRVAGKLHGEHKGIKDIPLVGAVIEQIEAKDILYIQDNIMGKSSSVGPRWKQV